MAMIEINRVPSRRELMWFGAVFMLFFALVGALFRWQFGAPGVSTILWPAAVAVTAMYYILPPLRRPLYLGWMYATFPIGWILSHLLLGAVYYLIFTPVGLMMRGFGRDPLCRRFDPGTRSYWVEHHPGERTERYFRQF
jgi:hypothetical protein